MPKRIKEHFQKENNKELIEMAAEQFARLFWKHCLYNLQSKKSKSQNQNIQKSNKGSS